MRYLKTYESFSINEEFLGGLFNKINNAFSNWKNEKMKTAGEKLSKAIEEKKNDPEMSKALSELKIAYGKLSPEDKAKVQSFKDEKNIPVQSESSSEVMDESLLLEEEGKVSKVLSYLGFTSAAVSFVTLIITVIQIALEGSAYSTTLFGLSLGTLGAICMASTFLFGIGGSIAQSVDDGDFKKKK